MRTQTMRAFSADEMEKILAKVAQGLGSGYSGSRDSWFRRSDEEGLDTAVRLRFSFQYVFRNLKASIEEERRFTDELGS